PVEPSETPVVPVPEPDATPEPDPQLAAEPLSEADGPPPDPGALAPDGGSDSGSDSVPDEGDRPDPAR
ncbi:MAG: helix-hairpin-helix domain-containing protein, partial [Actinomycetota bacterium]|nr:helix-hairpin-helix domain-containing protein [Actinomycetota bacterium]